MRLRVLGAELNGVPVDADHIYDFCVSGLVGRRQPRLTCAAPTREPVPFQPGVVFSLVQTW